jgi:hypothetical protein
LHGAPPEVVRKRLDVYRAELDATVWRLQRQAHRIRHFLFLETSQEQTMPTPPITLEHDDERRLAATLFNQTWDYLEKIDRTKVDDDTMLHSAHASRYHWGVVGQPVNWARGEWQCSRAYAVLGRDEPALHHGQRCLELVEEHDLGPFDIGYAHEAIARSLRTAGKLDEAARHVDLARAAAEKITDAEERDLLIADLDQLR